ncbi:DNA-binding MarR family transcriptional regulator [Lutibacter oceani]|uniref:DNA-binding MarR family transcriptional regulator n=1 Tax=Lutibacter oceani TaxID=1853311 RepID=A0A3D9RWH7_9FLAO|nr:MarR family transcriptional regulator [Lutibacter oceani]REE81934.1 DNA-binding MarR family transcriptional regulator [Lutibacter oceani]
MEIDIKLSDFNETILPWLGKTSKLMNMFISDVFHKNNIQITKQQWIVLKILSEKSDGIIQNELACITERNKASLTRLINVMEKNNLVARVPSKLDSRKNLIKITHSGEHLFNITKPIMIASIKAIENNISVDEMNIFLKVMSKIQTNLKINQLN